MKGICMYNLFTAELHFLVHPDSNCGHIKVAASSNWMYIVHPIVVLHPIVQLWLRLILPLFYFLAMSSVES